MRTWLLYGREVDDMIEIYWSRNFSESGHMSQVDVFVLISETKDPQ